VSVEDTSGWARHDTTRPNEKLEKETTLVQLNRNTCPFSSASCRRKPASSLYFWIPDQARNDDRDIGHLVGRSRAQGCEDSLIGI
jgi:hypothetical protein